MRRLFKVSLVAASVAGVAAGAWAFSLLGPYKTWQVAGIGYQIPGRDIAGPMETTEAYRWNSPVIYYAVDSSFLNYFGTLGEAEVDKAFAILNALPPASQMSASLTEFPTTGMLREHPMAATLGIIDVKSRTLELVLEQLGLGDSIRFIWNIRESGTFTAGGQTFTNYVSRKLHFDPVTLTPSTFVNGTAYGYDIIYPLRPNADAEPIERQLDSAPDSLGDPTPVATGANGAYSYRPYDDDEFVRSVRSRAGRYWIGLTRDDAGGLRFLLRTNLVLVETVPPGTEVAVTNRAAQVALTNLDVETFRFNTRSTTNDPAALQRIYPDLVIGSSNSLLTVQFQSAVTFTNPAPFSNFFAFRTNSATNFVTLYDYTNFPNLVTNRGRVYIVPTNLHSYEFVSDLLTNEITVTNVAANQVVVTNGLVLTNAPIALTNESLDTFILLTAHTTNAPAQVTTLYSNLVITNVSLTLTALFQTGIIFTNPVAFSNAWITNRTFATNIATLYDYQFANVVTNLAARSIYIVPTNLLGYFFVSPLLTNTVTNVVPVPGAVEFTVGFVDTNAPFVLTNVDLANFIDRTKDGTIFDPVSLQTIYPNLVITNFSFLPGVVPQTNITFQITNTPAGPMTVLATNVLFNILTQYFYYKAFANVVTNLDPVRGDTIYVVPTNLLGFSFVSNLLTVTESVTNALTNLTLNFFTNTAAPTAVTTIDLVTFFQQAKTNPPAGLLTLYPDLVLTSTNVTITNAVLTNFTFYLTNHPFAPAGSPAEVVFVPVYSNVLVTNFSYTFGNLFTNNFFTSGFVNHQSVRVYEDPFAPAGSGLVTNVFDNLVVENFANGGLYIVPTNLLGYLLVSQLFTTVVPMTNLIQPAFVGTNLATNVAVVFTNDALVTYATNYTFSVYPVEFLVGSNRLETVTVFTNQLWSVYPVTNVITATNSVLRTNVFTDYVWAVYPVQSNLVSTGRVEVVSTFTNVTSAVYPVEYLPSANSEILRQGVDKLTFTNVTRRFDSLIGRFFIPFTDVYTNRVVTNSVVVNQIIRRIIGRPDILFVTEDLDYDPDQLPFLNNRSGTGAWINNDALNGQAAQGGPGVIAPPQGGFIRLSFTDQLPVFFNQTPSSLDETSAAGGFVWGAFDGTTNAPIVFPSFISLQYLEQLIYQPPPPP